MRPAVDGPSSSEWDGDWLAVGLGVGDGGAEVPLVSSGSSSMAGFVLVSCNK